MIDLNIGAVVAVGLVCIPYMESGSFLKNIASWASFFPLPYQNIYSSTKVFVRNYEEKRHICLWFICKNDTCFIKNYSTANGNEHVG